MRALILAAGEGRRMRPLTQIIPKPLIPVAGVPLAVRQIKALKKAGICEIVMNVAHGGVIARQLLGDGSDFGVKITYSLEGSSAPKALETLGGIAKALPLLTEGERDEAFIVVAGDILTDFDFSRLVCRGRELVRENLDAHLVTVPNPSYHKTGDMFIDPLSLVRETPKTYTFSSMGVYRKSLFADVPVTRAKLFPWLWEACAGGRVSGEVWNGLWFNVGDAYELRAAERFFAQNPERE